MEIKRDRQTQILKDGQTVTEKYERSKKKRD